VARSAAFPASRSPNSPSAAGIFESVVPLIHSVGVSRLVSGLGLLACWLSAATAEPPAGAVDGEHFGIVRGSLMSRCSGGLTSWMNRLASACSSLR
jgi:hypothetical protein